MAESVFSQLVFGRPIDISNIGGISASRNIDLNLFYTIKEKILPINGYVSRNTETVSPLTQSIDPVTDLVVTPYQSKYYDWVYYNPDPSNPSLTGLLTTPNLSTSGALAYIDYVNGTVYYSGVQTQDITMTYDYYSVYVQDGFPDWGEDVNTIKNLRVPCVTVDLSTRMPSPFALGGTFQDSRNFIIDILANNDPQRDDLTELIQTSLRYDYTNTIDYRQGFPIGFNGDKNLNFDRGPASRFNTIRFNDTSSRVIRDPGAPDKFRHHSLIMLTCKTIG